MRLLVSRILGLWFMFALLGSLRADVGDPQIRTDHPWYPGELACSTFERLFATQAELYQRVTGILPRTEQEKALASWLWRNTHYWHGEEGAEDLWGQGFIQGGDRRTREYWTGLYAHGFGLCGTTHSQWVAEMEALLGHGRGRGVGVEGHNAFEVFLRGDAYDSGKWVLLDHDLSTVIFNQESTGLLSVAEVQRDWKRFTDRQFYPHKQQGWLVCGLAPEDGNSYRQYNVAEYMAGYSGAPPLVHLRRGETLRRYLRPGLEDGKTFVFWGKNDNRGGTPGPERAQTWVNQPERMYRSTNGAGFQQGRARYANAVYRYQPDFSNEDWREGVIDADDRHVVFEFYTPYIIAATPADDKPWGIYDSGCRNGLALKGTASCAVSLSTDQGQTWQDCGPFRDGMDLTDVVKGRRQYWIRFQTGVKELKNAGLTMITTCQANAATMPRLKDNGSRVEFLASNRAVISAGPNIEQAKAHLVAGKFGTPQVTLEIAPPRKEETVAIYAAGHVFSSNPPRPEVKYQIEYSINQGKNWSPIVKDWSIVRTGDEPKDFWSQSLCWGSKELSEKVTGAIWIRFRNDGGKAYGRCEAHLVYRTKAADPMEVTFDWSDSNGPHRASHRFSKGNSKDASNGKWQVSTGRDVQTHWVELRPVR